MLLLATWQADVLEVMNLKPAEYVDNSGGYCSLSLMSLLAWKNGVGRGCREFRVVLYAVKGLGAMSRALSLHDLKAS